MVRKKNPAGNKGEITVGNKPAENSSAGTKFSGSDFLKTTFKSFMSREKYFPASYWFKNTFTVYDPKKVCDDLIQALQTYSKVANVSFDLIIDSDMSYDAFIAKLYDQSCLHLPEGWHSNIEYDRDTDLFFFVYYKFMNDWDDATLWYVPCDYLFWLKDQNPDLHDLIIPWLKIVSNKITMPLWDDNGMEWSNSWVKEEIENHEDIGLDPEDLELYKKLISDYYDGQPAQYLKQINSSKIGIKTIKSKLSKIVTNDEFESVLIGLMFDIMHLIESGFNMWQFTSYTGVTSIDDEGDALTHDRWLGFVWSLDDELFERYFEMFNQDAGELGCRTPTQFYIVNTHTKKPLKESDHITRFSKWLESYAKHINKFIDQKRNE